MLKKYLFFVLVICVGFLFSSCKEEEDKVVFDVKNWNGQYASYDENGEAGAVLTVKKIGDKTLEVSFESRDAAETFSAEVKSENGRIVVVNASEKAITITAEEDLSNIEVDDMWTGKKIEDRKVNWSGEYRRLTEEEKVPSFEKD